MRAKLRRINSVEESRGVRIFTRVEEILHRVGVVVVPEVIEILDVWIIIQSRAPVAASQLMATHVIHGFLFRSVLINLPGKELVEGVSGQPGAGQQIGPSAAWLREDFGLIGGRD